MLTAPTAALPRRLTLVSSLAENAFSQLVFWAPLGLYPSIFSDRPGMGVAVFPALCQVDIFLVGIVRASDRGEAMKQLAARIWNER